jgi:transcriptional regulator with XRE-family HTH domain
LTAEARRVVFVKARQEYMPNWNIPVKPNRGVGGFRLATPLSPTVYSSIPGGYASAVSLARNISTLRRAARLNQADLGARLNVGQPAVSKWERGETEPEASILPALARELGASLDELLRGLDVEYDASDLLRPSTDQGSGSQGGPGDVPASRERRLLRQVASLNAAIVKYKTRLHQVRHGARQLANLAAGRGEGRKAARGGA